MTARPGGSTSTARSTARLAVGQPPRADSIQHAAPRHRDDQHRRRRRLLPGPDRRGPDLERRPQRHADPGPARPLLHERHRPDRPLRPRRGHRHQRGLERRRRTCRRAHERPDLDGRPAAHPGQRRRQQRAGRRHGHDRPDDAHDRADADGDGHEPRRRERPADDELPVDRAQDSTSRAPPARRSISRPPATAITAT